MGQIYTLISIHVKVGEGRHFLGALIAQLKEAKALNGLMRGSIPTGEINFCPIGNLYTGLLSKLVTVNSKIAKTCNISGKIDKLNF